MDLLQLCVLGNLCPETVEEAIAMVPSIKVEIICLSFLIFFSFLGGKEKGYFLEEGW
jgi:hypothetical protein